MTLKHLQEGLETIEEEMEVVTFPKSARESKSNGKKPSRSKIQETPPPNYNSWFCDEVLVTGNRKK